MRRLFSMLLALCLFFACCFAEGMLQAGDIALEMANSMPEMQDIRSAALDDAPNRVIWNDSRTDGRCALTVYADADEAGRAAVARGTRHTSARTAGSCLLEIDSDLSVNIVDAYVRLLADVLGVEADAAEPDYILNVNTKKFHVPSCSSVEDMKESNRQPYAGDREELISQGYKACKRCNP